MHQSSAVGRYTQDTLLRISIEMFINFFSFFFPNNSIDKQIIIIPKNV